MQQGAPDPFFASRRAVGIVGHGADKFTPLGEQRARALIRHLLDGADVAISGHSPLGGVDIWTELEAGTLNVPTDIKAPTVQAWDPPNGYGYKARNLDIAHDSTEVHVIVVDVLPETYKGRRFPLCYHCHRDDHVKSGGCWTGKRAGSKATWHIIANY